MKIAIFSDIHGNLQALTAILKDIKENDIDKVYCLGDVIGIGPNPKECLDLIIENKVNMVLGNHELYYLKGTKTNENISKNEKEHQKWVSNQLSEKHRNFLDNCKLKIEEKFENIIITYQHFIFKNNFNIKYPFENLKILNDGSINEKLSTLNANIIFIGHEHKAFEIEINNKKLIDVGSSGCTKDKTTFYTIVTINKSNIKIEKKNIIYNRKEFEKTMYNIEYPEKEFISKIFFHMDTNTSSIEYL